MLMINSGMSANAGYLPGLGDSSANATQLTNIEHILTYAAAVPASCQLNPPQQLDMLGRGEICLGGGQRGEAVLGTHPGFPGKVDDLVSLVGQL